MLIAHRGIHNNIDVPENSLSAFEIIKSQNAELVDGSILKSGAWFAIPEVVHSGQVNTTPVLCVIMLYLHPKGNKFNLAKS